MNRETWDANCRKYNYKGFGNEDGKFWFVGLDFHGDNDDATEYTDGEIVYPICPAQIKKESCGKHHTNIYSCMAKVMWNLRGIRDGTSHIDYRDSRLLQPGDNSLFTNLFAFSRPDAQAPLTRTMSEMGFDSVEGYYETMREFRFPMLRSYWEKTQPAFTVCFGESFWAQFRVLFGLPGEGIVLTLRRQRPKVCFYPEQGVFLVPFFGNGRIKGEDVDAVVKKMRDVMPEAVPVVDP